MMNRPVLGMLTAITILCIFALSAEARGSSRHEQRTCSRFRPCPIIDCAPGYRLVRRQFWEYGRRCYDCGRCVYSRPPRQTLRSCPNIFCGQIPPNCQLVLPPPVLNFQGTPCLGCSRCAPPCEDIACIALACPFPGPRAVIRRPGREPCLGCESCPDFNPAPLPFPPSPIPPDCAAVGCIFPEGCPGRVITPPGECCPICPGPPTFPTNPPNCAAVSCVLPNCPNPITPVGQCCPVCTGGPLPPRCAAVSCLRPNCPNSVRPQGQCCSVCPAGPTLPPNCATVLCARLNCADIFTPPGQCCPVCTSGPVPPPNCAAVSCAAPGPDCNPITLPGQCCPICQGPPPFPVDCSRVRCSGIPPGCTRSVTPPGQCCPMCVDNNPILTAPCPNNNDVCLPVRPDCPSIRPGSITTFLGQQCSGCPSCAVPQDCSVIFCPPIPSDCPQTFTPEGMCCPVCVRPCPAVFCAAFVPNCPSGPAIRPVTVSNGQLCTGCLSCPSPAQGSCPLVSCASPTCVNPIPSTFSSNGVECSGCPVCTVNPIQCIRAPCPGPLGPSRPSRPSHPSRPGGFY